MNNQALSPLIYAALVGLCFGVLGFLSAKEIYLRIHKMREKDIQTAYKSLEITCWICVTAFTVINVICLAANVLNIA